MSHYSVLVMSEGFLDEEGLKKVLAPFDENVRVPVYVAYTKEQLIAEKRKEIEEYRKTTYAEYLKNPSKYRERYGDNENHLNYVENEFPKKLNYTDEECYQEAIQYYEPEEIDENGSVLSQYNPKSKWDWYQIGGRFGCIGKDKEIGEMVCCGFAQNLDFSEDNEAYKEGLRFWELIVDGESPKDERDNEILRSFHFRREYYKERYETKEWYAKMCSMFSTYAVLKPDGTWLAPGEMGWFGVSSAEEEDEKKWDKEYVNLLNEAIEKNYYLVLVDCHI